MKEFKNTDLETETLYMNPLTGSVDTLENWKLDYIKNPESWNSGDDLENLIEVEWDTDENCWQEVI